MIRARFVVAATLVGACLAVDLASAQGTEPLKPILSGKKFTAPVRGQADVEITAPVTRRDKDLVVTKIQVKNVSTAPIARLTVRETWYDKANAVVAGSTGAITGLLQPGEIQTLTIETPYNAKMSANNFNFSHANGTVNPKKVAKMTPPPDAAKK